ncbi:phage tail spike protein, partial [Bacillus thuringiensis]
MRTPSGILHVVDSQTDQIIGAIQSKDYWNDNRHWEIKNNVDKLDFTVFDGTKEAAALTQQNLVLKEVRGGRIVPYTITETEKDSNNRSLTTYASGEWILLGKANYIDPQKFEAKTVGEYVDIALKGTKWKKGNISYESFRSMTVDEFIDPLSFLKKVASLFELEIQYRTEVVGNHIERYVDMMKKRGQDTGKTIELGKDLIGIKRIENSQNICTALIGFVKGEGDNIITIEKINNGLPYITNIDAFQRWNEKGKHKFGFYSPETDNENMSPDRLKTLMEIEMKKRVNASVSYEVKAASIGRVFGLAHELINEGDTIRIKDTGFTPKLYLEARAIAGDESFTDPTQDKYVFGDYREIVDPNEELRKIYNQILGSLGSKQEMLDQLEKLIKENGKTIETIRKESQAAKELAEKVQENLKNNTVNIIEAKNGPTDNLIVGKTLWRDISNGKPGILKVWNGKGWELLIPDVESVKKDTLEQVKKDIESTKIELNEKVQGVEEKAKDIAGQIVNVQKQVNDKVDQTWINSQLKDKADKTGVYTKDEIKDGFIGKQIYETDKNGNVKQFQDINTSIGQTNEALTQKAENSELTKTNEGLTKLQNKTNEIETTANGTKQKLSEIETTVNNTNIGVRNYVLDSDKFISPPNTMQSFKFVNDLKDLQGKQVTLSVYVEIKNAKIGVHPSNRVGFEPSIRYSDNSIQHLGAWLRITDGMNFKGIISTTLWIKDIEILKTEQNAVYIQCGGDYVKVGRPKIEIGNKVTDWTPAPEDQVTTTDFTKKTVEIETTVKGINTTVSNVQNEQGKLTERMTKSEQIADGFKTSIESLTKKDTEISNKLNTVEQTVEGTKKTISDVLQTTSELKKTTTEITEKAGQISEKLISVEQKYDNMKIGGQNFYKQKSFGAAGGTTVKYDESNKWWDIAIPAGASGSWKGILYTSKNAVLLVGRTYTISYEIYADEVIPTAIDINNFGVTTVTGTNDNDFVAKRIMRTSKTIAGQWVKVSATFIMPDNITQDFYDNSVIGVGNGWTPTKTTNIKIRNMQLEEGNIPTSYRIPSEDQVTTDEFTKKTTDIVKSVDGIKENITKVEQNQTGFDKRVATVEKTADGIKQNVTSLQEIQTNQGKQLQEAKAGWETTAKALEGKVEIKDVEEYVGGIGNQNVLRNVLWKNDTKYWVLQSGTTRDTTVLYKGCNTLRTISTGNTADVYRGASHEVINAGPGWNYVFSAYFYTDNKSSIDNGAKMELKCLDANGNVLKQYGQDITLTQGMWVRHHVFGLLVDGTKKVQVQYWLRRNGRLWAAQPMLQIGDKPSSFMENPVDIVDKDKIMEEVADKIATEKYNQKVTELERSINANEKGISLVSGKQETFINETYKGYVTKTESRLEVLDEGIIAQILKDGIVTAINMSPGKITINAAKLDINADTMVKWLTAKGIDTNLIRIDGDKITIDKDGVTVKMLDFLFQDEWGTKTTAVSRRNLIADPDFSSVTKKNIGHNDYYGFEGGYGLTWKSWGNVVIEKNTHIFDYEQMVNAARVDIYNYPEAIVNNGIHPGNEYTASAHFRTAMINGVRKTGKPRIHVCCVKFRDNVSYDILSEQKMDFPEPSTFYGEIRRYSFTFKVPTNYIPQQHALIIKVCS